MKRLVVMLAAAFAALGAWADTQKVGDYTWTYRIVDGMAEIDNEGDTAISPYPEGAITIPSTLGGKTVVRIGDSAMSYLGLLTSVKMPASVTSIGCYTFNECRNLESVEMPGVKEIGANAFSSCVSLSSVVMPDDVKILGPAAFASCPGDESGLVIFNNVVYGGAYDIPSRVVVPDTVTRIADYALSRFYNLKSVLIPGNVKSIGEYAFYESDLGEGVVICDGVQDIGTGAFYNTEFKSIAIPGSVSTIGDDAWAGDCLTSATILDGVKTIGTSAFRSYHLTSISIPPSVTTVGSEGIYGGVKTVYVAAGDADRVKEVLPIPDTQLDMIDFVEPSGAYTVTLNANGGVCGAPSVKVKKGAAAGDLPAAARKDYAFAGWFTAANGGERVTESTPVNGNVTFYAHWLSAPGGELCEKVNGYTWYFRVGDDGNAEIYPGKDGYAVSPRSSGALTIPAKLGGLDVTGIGDYAFQYYDALTSVTIPASMTSIGYAAFFGCSRLASVMIPDSVTSIENYAFKDCSSLTGVLLPKRFEGNLDSTVFQGCPEGLSVSYYDALYAVRFHRNDASDEMVESRDFAYGVEMHLPGLNNGLGWARRGFDFKGWATSAANAAKGVVWKKDWAVVSAAAAAGKTLDVYAVWALKPNSYAIEFIRNDGAGTWRTVGFNYGEKTRMPSLANGLGWARRGYAFKGWALTTADANAGKVWKGDWAYVSTPVKAGKVLTAYAVWELKPGFYQIRFNKNDGTGKWRSLGYEYGVPTKLSTVKALGWSVSGKTFKGWATSAANAAAGKVWKADGAAASTAADAGRTLGIYAIWQ